MKKNKTGQKIEVKATGKHEANNSQQESDKLWHIGSASEIR